MSPRSSVSHQTPGRGDDDETDPLGTGQNDQVEDAIENDAGQAGTRGIDVASETRRLAWIHAISADHKLGPFLSSCSIAHRRPPLETPIARQSPMPVSALVLQRLVAELLAGCMNKVIQCTAWEWLKDSLS